MVLYRPPTESVPHGRGKVRITHQAGVGGRSLLGAGPGVPERHRVLHQVPEGEIRSEAPDRPLSRPSERATGEGENLGEAGGAAQGKPGTADYEGHVSCLRPGVEMTGSGRCVPSGSGHRRRHPLPLSVLWGASRARRTPTYTT